MIKILILDLLIINIYNKLMGEDDEMRIVYKLDNTKEKIKIFNENFVKLNKNKCKIIYDKKEYKLNEFFETKKIKKGISNKFEIILKGIKQIDIDNIFFGCTSLISLPTISKLNKNINFNKDDLLPEIKICKSGENISKDIQGSLVITLIGDTGSGKLL